MNALINRIEECLEEMRSDGRDETQEYTLLEDCLLEMAGEHVEG
jgi:hypothetical protein